MNKLIKGFLAIMTGSMVSAVQAQTPATTNSTDIYRKMEKLKVLGTVLYFAAHPDDENTRLLAYLAKEKQYRTGYLSLTRGDGGQNLIGNEQGVELGLIRTQELLAARRIDGAEQMFSSAYDFGFSKSSDEALAIWNHDKILSDAVYLIRSYKPDVIITRFPGDARAGHGHHAASAILANEAFTAAADSTRFPEQLKNGLSVWKAKRILWNTFNFGGNNTTSEEQFKMDVGVYNPMLGEGYGEIASESRSQHKSQGFGVARQRGTSFEYFLTTGGDAPKKELMDGIGTTWSRVKGGDKIAPMVNQLVKDYNFSQPDKSVPALVNLYKAIESLPANTPYREQKLKELSNLIADCCGFFAEAVTGNAYAVKGQMVKINITANNRSAVPVVLNSLRINNQIDTVVNHSMESNLNWNMSYTMQVSESQPVSQPYWLANPMTKGRFDIQNQTSLEHPENQPAYTVAFNIQVNGLNLELSRPLQYKYTDAVKGEIYEPVTVIEPVIVSVSPAMTLLNIKPGNEKTQQPVIDVQYKSNITATAVPVTVQLWQQNKMVFTHDTVMDLGAGSTYNQRFQLKTIFQSGETPELSAAVVLSLNGKKYNYNQYLRHIAYDHIPDVNYFSKSTMKVVSEEIKTAGRTIGYIPGAGDKVPPALEQMGYEVTILNEADITPAGLRRFDAVITGVRAYNVNDYLDQKYPILMQYVQEGGNMIVQYNTNTGIGPIKARMAPYPLQVTTKRVTEENAAVKIALPEHPVLNYPNKITQADFEGWVQERSIYQAEKLDEHYQAPLIMADKGETESNGSLVIAPYGKGNFVYTGLVFYRELPAGVPGAFRLMANLIALPKHQ